MMNIALIVIFSSTIADLLDELIKQTFDSLDFLVRFIIKAVFFIIGFGILHLFFQRKK